MKRFLNWLLCHNVMIVVGLFVLAAWVYRAEIFGLQGVSEPPVEPAVAMPAAKPLVPDSGGTFPGLEPVVPAVAPLVDPAVDPLVEQQPAGPLAADSAPEAFPQMPAEIVPAPAEAEPELQPESQPGQQPQVQSPPEAAVDPAPAVEAEVVQFPESAKDTPEKVLQRNDYQFRDAQTADAAPAEMDLLQKARQAYWNDDLQKSRSLYQAYIELNPDNPDGYGELGNLLSTLGDLDTASDMYRRAADLLIAQGENEQAARLMDVLDSIEVIQNSAK